MKKMVILSVLLLGACSFIPPQVEFLYTDAYNIPVYVIECNNRWGLSYCYKKADQTCPYGFNVIDKSENSYADSDMDGKVYGGIRRSLIFQCK